MDFLDKLAETARRQHEEADLPEWLVEEIVALSASPVPGPAPTDLYRLLLQQVEDFDSYAGAGCFGDSVTAATIAATLDRLRNRD
ncbi:hypothetical protein KP001_16845 [Geomonas subterranea]|uniref:Addiction module component n=1 Tax=Geomonas subterranea TaxID=2847989 RepID=A0ABX8LFF1_9BACT|nr:hypothetical protein [Geomonas subterranea]QXE90071.1 hypothetical protein KP001_16845 [Geomonas subterranea]QXM07807.1 hypothetical protein KP002_12435 [Geomonas subterranea]